MAELNQYYEIIENAIQLIAPEIDPSACRATGQDGKVIEGQWNLKKGEQSVWIDLWYIENQKRSYFQVIGPMLDIPYTIPPGFYRELLELNNELFGVAFCISKGKLMVKVIREADGLDAKEANAMIMRVGNYATHYTPILKEKYFNNDNPGAAPDHN